MTTKEVAKRVVDLLRKQAWYEALDTLYDDNIVSIEAFNMSGGSPETRGKEAVRGKIDWWVNATEVHSFTADGPFVAHDRFVVESDADVTDKEIRPGQVTIRDRLDPDVHLDAAQVANDIFSPIL
jgi:hypothetical protein